MTNSSNHQEQARQIHSRTTAAVLNNRENQSIPSSFSEQPAVIVALTRPKRPLSAYNLFFQNRRLRLQALKQQQQLGKKETKEGDSVKTKRAPRESGKIAFANMAKVIAKEWKAASPEVRQPFEAMAATESARHKKEMAEYNRLLKLGKRKNRKVKARSKTKKPAQKRTPAKATKSNAVGSRGVVDGSALNKVPAEDAMDLSIEPWEPLPLFVDNASSKNVGHDDSFTSLSSCSFDQDDEEGGKCRAGQGLVDLIEDAQTATKAPFQQQSHFRNHIIRDSPTRISSSSSLPSMATTQWPNVYEQSGSTTTEDVSSTQSLTKAVHEVLIRELAQKLEGDCMEWIIETFRE